MCTFTMLALDPIVSTMNVCVHMKPFYCGLQSSNSKADSVLDICMHAFVSFKVKFVLEH